MSDIERGTVAGRLVYSSLLKANFVDVDINFETETTVLAGLLFFASLRNVAVTKSNV